MDSDVAGEGEADALPPGVVLGNLVEGMVFLCGVTLVNPFPPFSIDVALAERVGEHDELPSARFRTRMSFAARATSRKDLATIDRSSVLGFGRLKVGVNQSPLGNSS